MKNLVWNNSIWSRHGISISHDSDCIRMRTKGRKDGILEMSGCISEV